MRKIILTNEFINNFKGGFTPTQSRLFFGILQESVEREVFEFSMSSKDFFKLKGAKNMTKKRVVENMYKVVQKGITLENVETGEVQFLNPIEYIEYCKEDKKINVKVIETFKDTFCKETNNSTTIDLDCMSKLKTWKGIKLYMITSMYKKTGTVSMDLKQFKRILGIPKKTSISNIKKRILEKIVPEINQCTDLKLEYKIYKDENSKWKIKWNVIEEVE